MATPAKKNTEAPRSDGNLSIWDRVEKTNPEYTKAFNRTGFKGTATNPTWIMKRATEIFGPAGIGWGWEILNEDYREGHEILPGLHAVIHVIRVQVWYRHPDTDEVGKIIHYGQTTFVGKYQSGPYTDEEAPKKSLTDAIGKALVSLGFSADIHMGLYDDNKYVNDVRKEFKETGAEKREPDELEKEVNDFVAKFEAASTIEELDAARMEAILTYKKCEADRPILARQMKMVLMNRRAAIGIQLEKKE